jgi:hypothetical protein
MANIEVKYAYVNKKKFTEGGDKSRLNLQLSESRKDKKTGKTSYINYMTTLWGQDAIKYNDILVSSEEKTADAKSSSVCFKGWITEVNSILSKKDNQTIYTTILVNILNDEFGLNEGSAAKSGASTTANGQELDEMFS